MKPDWDKLMKEFEGHKTTLVADVDCTADGKALCEEVGVQGYPTIKSGDPSDLQVYEGGRDFAALKKHAEGLGPLCSPANVGLCDDAKKQQIKEYAAMSQAARDKAIAEKQGAIEKAEADFKELLEGLQKTYKEADEKKSADIKAIKDSGLGLLKSVNAHVTKGGKIEL